MGFGDAIMATGEVKRLRKKHPNAKFAIGDGVRWYWNEIFDNNPYLLTPEILGSENIKNYKKVIWINNYEGNRPYRNYGEQYPKDNYNWKKKHKAQRGEIFFSSKEITLAKLATSNIKKKNW